MQLTEWQRTGITRVRIPSHERIVEVVGVRRRATRVVTTVPARLPFTGDHSGAHRIMIASCDACSGHTQLIFSPSRPRKTVRASVWTAMTVLLTRKTHLRPSTTIGQCTLGSLQCLQNIHVIID